MRKRRRTTVQLDAVTRSTLEAEFQRGFYETVVGREPDNLECLVELGDLYNREGQYEKSLAIDTHLTGLFPEEPVFQYNLACSYSLLDRCDRALAALRSALDLGYEDFSNIEQDEDLETLRQTAEFQDLMLERFGTGTDSSTF